MTSLRIINLIVWGALLLYMLPGAWAAVRGLHARHGDPMRLAVALTCCTILGFTLRGLIAPGNIASGMALYVLSILVAAYIAKLGYAYGRGPKL